jgi:hypothetical protein
MDRLGYAWEKFSTAIFSLAGEDRMRSRILSASKSFYVLQLSDFADYPELQEQYREIMDRLTAVRTDPATGHIPSTLESMSDDEAREIATLIIEMTFAIARQRLEIAKNSN